MVPISIRWRDRSGAPRPSGVALSPEGSSIGLFQKMVLPVRIELTTSALPRMRSTTELRQHSEPGGNPSAAGGAYVQAFAVMSSDRCHIAAELRRKSR